jgi:hypothetical protein
MTAILRRVPLEATEHAIRLLAETYADLTRSVGFAAWGRHLPLNDRSPGAYDHVAVRRESCYIRLISIVESYVDMASSERLRVDYVSTTPLLRMLIEDVDLTAVRGWPDRERTFSRYHVTPLKKVSQYDKLKAGTDVRNAIAHGVGRLTPRQRNQKTRKRIESVEVAVRDNCVVLTDLSMLTCLNYCRSFVSELDLLLPLIQRDAFLEGGSTMQFQPTSLTGHYPNGDLR